MKKRYSITMHEKTHELLLALAKDNNCLIGEIIGRLLADFIKQQGMKDIK